MTLKNNNRNIVIDALKGFLILLVVIGHCIQYIYAPLNFDNNIIFNIIYSFHMPLFMFVSGYIVSMGNKNINLKWLKKRVLVLLLPFLSWSIIAYFILGRYHKSNIINYLCNVILYPDNGLWFLWVLMLNCVCLYVGILFNKKLGDWTYLIINMIILLIPIQLFGIGLLKVHFTFYIMGYLTLKYVDLLGEKTKSFIKGICIIFFPLGALFWRRTGNSFFLDIINTMDIPGLFNSIIIASCKILHKYIVPFLGIGFFINISYCLKGFYKSKIIKFLAFLGTKTIEIYTMQWYFWRIIKTDNVIVNTIIGMLLSVCAPLVISYFLEKNKFLSMILFGKRL